MDKNFYLNSDNWIGGFYELSIEYHPAGNDKRINDALFALKASRCFHGLWAEKKDFQKPAVSLPVAIEDASVRSFYGMISRDPGEEELPCMITVTRIEGESDWLDISIPQAVLEKRFRYRYPLTIEENHWLMAIHEIYEDLAESIYLKSPFDLAMIGEEITAETTQKELTVEFMENKEYIIFILPNRLVDRLGMNGSTPIFSNRLRIF